MPVQNNYYYQELNSLLKEQRIQKKSLCSYLGITEKTLQNKMNKFTPFTADEIFKIAELLEISDTDLKRIFYIQEVEYQETR